MLIVITIIIIIDTFLPSTLIDTFTKIRYVIVCYCTQFSQRWAKVLLDLVEQSFPEQHD